MVLGVGMDKYRITKAEKLDVNRLKRMLAIKFGKLSSRKFDIPKGLGIVEKCAHHLTETSTLILPWIFLDRIIPPGTPSINTRLTSIVFVVFVKLPGCHNELPAPINPRRVE
ncbi:hypothetical protein PGT21_034178 [Puccinia graminis f. sp. tritici]|uniref:Uncharacterized protein n=1 Tax=Puccinia graminis f. sp. tritici TaxID=56615 RepID=A0A5B0RKB5_PUCGR|nr:hypothetical protein PGT21_034178 [Puccinia graminis f. sp. tritici]KAA1125383.1 hypothetical protein PGTUg99_017446 [Puccinia graminis f. sp. tritici]